MTEDPKTKGILDTALNMVSSRDEKAALEDAKNQIVELQKKVAGLEAELAQTQSNAKTAGEKVVDLQQRLLKTEWKAKLYDEEQAKKVGKAAAAASEAASTLEMHTLADDEILSHLALKYYGHATKKYWSLIYEANKEAIGSNPNKVRPGTVLRIPVLPADMKK